MCNRDVEGEAPPCDSLGHTPSLGELVDAEALRAALGAMTAAHVGIARVHVLDRWGNVFVSVSTSRATPKRLHDYPIELHGERVATLQLACGDNAATELVPAVCSLLRLALAGGARAWMTSQVHLAAAERSLDANHVRAQALARASAHLNELDTLKRNFLATVSHELRTPLTAMLGFSEVLLEDLAGALNPEQASFVRTIRERGEELLSVISHILEMSELEVGSLGLELTSCSIHPLLDRAVRRVSPVAAQASTRIEIATNAAEAPRVLVDARKMQQVVEKLLANAVKFSTRGGVVQVRVRTGPLRRPLSVEARFGEEAHDALVVEIEDNGIGIPDEELLRIFEPFYQVDASSTRVHGGTGLGLSIAKSLIGAHGGEVWASSGVGEGTVVSFTVPLAAANVQE